MIHKIKAGDGVTIHVEGHGEAGAPVLVLAHSVGCDLHLWDAQVAALERQFQILRYDARGHGRSDVPPGAYDVATLGGDALAVLDALGVEAAHFCGLSLGGTTGQWLALNAPSRLLSLTLADTASRVGTIEGWQARIDAAMEKGTGSIATMSMTRFFSDAFRAAAPDVVERFRARLANTADEGFAGCCAVLRDCDFSERLGEIVTPTLVLCGQQDLPTPPADSIALANGIPGAALCIIEAGHLSAVENPDAFNAALVAHISAVG